MLAVEWECLLKNFSFTSNVDLLSGHEALPTMPPSQRISLETNVIPDTHEKKHQQHHHRHHSHHQNAMDNHESFLMCPGRRPIKIDSNKPVSINIFFENIVQENEQRDKRGEIYLRIKDGGEEQNNYHNRRNHANNNINAYHNKLMSDENTSKAAESTTTSSNGHANKSGDRMQNNLIKNNNHDNNNNSNNNNNSVNNKNIIESENDGNVKHFINIYHYIVHSTADDERATTKTGKPRIVVRSSSDGF